MFFFIQIFDFKIQNLFTVYPTQATYPLIGSPGLVWKPYGIKVAENRSHRHNRNRTGLR